MALQKTEALSLGTGSLLDHSKSIVAFSSPNEIAIWSSSAIYQANETVEYSNTIWRSVTTNTSSTPTDTNPNWQIIYKNCKDGDVCFVFNGLTSNIMQRAGSVWLKYKQTSLQVNPPLIDGQITPASAITFIGSDSYFSKLEYTIKRGAGEGRKRAGAMNILNDGTNLLNYDHEFTEIGTDIQVWITPIISAGTVQIQYTSVAEGNPISMSYMLKGWK